MPATWQMVGEAVLQPKIDRYFADYPRGVRAAVTGGGVPLMRGATITHSTELTFEEILYPLNCGIATGVITSSGPTIHTFTPILTANPTIKTLSGEWYMSDGSSNFVAAAAAYGFCTGFDLSFAFNQVTQATYRYEFRHPTYAATPTTSLTPLTGREVIPSNLFKVYLDDTWAGRGVTQLTGVIRSGRLSVNTGITSDYTVDGRANMDFTQLKWGDNVDATLQLVMEMDTTSNTEITAWINQNASGASEKSRFIRLSATSPNAVAKVFQFDGAFIYAKEPSFSQQGNVEIVTLDLKSEYDPTSAKVILPVVKNSLTTFT